MDLGTARALGLSDKDFRVLLKVLCRTECGTLAFSFGNVSICLSSSGDNEVYLTVGLGNGRVEKSADYKFRSHELGVPKKHKKVNDFEGGE
jgi:hypothetical protein